MATRIKLKRSTVAATVPTTSNLEDGEVALNIADRKLYARNGSNIIEVANQKPNTGEVVTNMLSTDITNGQGNTYYVATVGSDTSTLANGGNAGLHPAIWSSVASAPVPPDWPDAAGCPDRHHPDIRKSPWIR